MIDSIEEAGRERTGEIGLNPGVSLSRERNGRYKFVGGEPLYSTLL